MGIGRRDDRHSFGQIQLSTKCDENLLAAEINALERYNLLGVVRPSGGGHLSNNLIVYGKFGREFLKFITEY